MLQSAIYMFTMIILLEIAMFFLSFRWLKRNNRILTGQLQKIAPTSYQIIGEGRGSRYISICFIGFGAVFASLMTIWMPEIETVAQGILYNSFIIILLVISPWLLLIFAFATPLIVCDKGLMKVSIFHDNFFVSWNEIDSVKWGKFGQHVFIVKTRKGIMEFDPFMNGFKFLAKSIITNLPEEKWVNAKKGFELEKVLINQ